MREAELTLNRIRGDLAAIREVAGLELPFGWEDVVQNLIAAGFGVYVALIGAFAPARTPALILVPTAGLVAVAVGLRVRWRRSTGRSPVRRREMTLNLAVGLIMGALAATFLVWARQRGEPLLLMAGMTLALCGGTCATLALSGRHRQYWFGPAVVLMGSGLALPMVDLHWARAGGGIAITVGCLLTAAIMAGQLRGQEASLEPAAH